MASKIQVAIVGCGGISKRHLEGYQELLKRGVDTFQIAACCDAKEQSAADWAKEIGAMQGTQPKVFADLATMLKELRLDAADICVPHALHHPVAIQCIEAGLHAMVEKPIGITIRATKKILEAAERHKRIVATAENIRRRLGQRTFHWAIHTQKMIGDLRMFYALQTLYRPKPAPSEMSDATKWRRQRIISGGGPVFDSGAHFADSIRYFFGEADTVYAQVKTFEPETVETPHGAVLSDTEDTWIATITFRSGLFGVWSFSSSLPGKPFLTVKYFGSQGCIEDFADVFHGFGGWKNIPGFNGKAELQKKDGEVISFDNLCAEYLLSVPNQERERRFPRGITHMFGLEIHDFLDAIAHNRRPEIDGWDGLKAKAICLAIYESAVSGQAVKVQDVIDGKVETYQKPINEKWGLA